ncbi:MAG: M28 family peptidase [Myxococcota bacterium]
MTGVTPDAPEKSLERQIRAFHWVRLLAEIADRRAGSAGEREAAERTAAWLGEIGFQEVALAPVPGAPGPGLRLALSLSLAALGCLLGGLPGLLLAGAALVSFRREERRGRPGLSRFLPARDSLNVVARAGAQRPRRRVVLSASLDAPQTGRIFGGGWVRRLGLRRPEGGGALAACERGLQAAVVVALAGALGAGGGLLAGVQIGVGVGLVLAAGLALQWATAPASPGANDAAGVAAMLTCGEQLLAQLRDDAELWLVAGGAGHAGARGLSAFLDAHSDWQSERTVFVHFDRVGGGTLHYLTSEGALERTVYPPRLRELARRLAEGGGFADVTPADFAGHTDGGELARRSLHALSLLALEEDGAPREDHSERDLPDRVEMETVIRAADFAAAVVVSHWRGDSDPLAVV